MGVVMAKIILKGRYYCKQKKDELFLYTIIALLNNKRNEDI